MGQQRLNRIDHPDDVGPGLPLNIQDDRRVRVDPGGQLGVFRAVDDSGDVRDAHRRAIAVGNDDRLVLRAGLKLVVVVNGPGLIRPVEVALGLVDVRAASAVRSASRLRP